MTNTFSNKTSVILLVGCLFSLICALSQADNTTLKAIKINETQINDGKDLSDLNRPYFDSRGRLIVDTATRLTSAFICPDRGREIRRKVLMMVPRVDWLRCSIDNSQSTESFIAGLNTDGTIVWQKRLGFVSGQYTLGEDVIGASSDGLLLNNLSVITPDTGEITIKAPTHAVAGESRVVPDHNYFGTGLYLPDMQGFLWFSTNVTLIKRSGGLLFINASTGQKELWLPVSTSLLGGFWNIEEMAVSEDRRYLFLAQRFATRGPGGVSVAIFDLKNKTIVFEEKFGKDHFCISPQIVVGDKDHFGFSFFDQTTRKRTLVHYQISP